MPDTASAAIVAAVDISQPATSVASFLSPDQRKDHLVCRDGMTYAGEHLLVDFYDAEHLDDIAYMDQALRSAVAAAGATLLHIHLHHFTVNGGISGVAVLAESHISVHSWPETGYAAFDVFMCGDARPEMAVAVLRERFCPGREGLVRHIRGTMPA
jgi:S-adenosylmethionine decarboxylase